MIFVSSCFRGVRIVGRKLINLGVLRALLLLLLLAVVSAAAAADTAADNEDLYLRLYQAVMLENMEGINQALQDGADINYRNPTTGQTVLMTSVLSGKTASVKALLQHGADTSIPEKDGFLPPHGAGFQGRADIMKLLYEHGLDIHAEHARDGYRPFHRACWGREQRHADTVRYLLSIGGTDVNVRASQNQKTCWEMTQNPATRDVLREYGAQQEEEL